MRAIRLLFRGLLWSGLLLLLLPLALTTALMTESGSSWLLRQTPDLVRPLGIQFSFNSSHGSLLGRLELKGVKITVADSRLEAARLLLQWRPLAIAGGTLHIQSLQLADAQLVLPVPVESAATAPEIPNIVLPIALQLDEFLLERLQIEQGETRLTVTRAALAAKFDAQGLVLRDLRYEGGGVQLEGAVSMQSTAPHNLVGEVSAIVDQALTGAEIGAIKARLELSGTALGPELDLTLSSPTTLRLRGSLKLDQLQPGFNLIAEWPELNWPLQGAATITTQTGRLELKGMVSDYQLELKTSVSGEGVPPADIELMAQGDAQGVKLQPLRIHSLDGELQVNGKVGWNETLNWELELLAERINPGLYLPEWPGRIDGRIEIDGALLTQPAGEIALQTRIHKLNGELRGQKISASGGLDYRAGEVRASKIELASGPNRIHLDGRADERLDLSFDIKAPQLATLYPGLSGRLEGAGRLKGTRQAPTVTAELKGYSVAYQDTLLQNIKLNLDWQESGGKGELRLTGLDAQGIQVSELSADLTGTPLSHSLKLEVRAAPYSVGLTAQGGLEARTWEGALARLTLDEPTLGEWRLQAPAKLRLSETLVRSEPLCMAQAATSLCAEGGWSKEKGVDIVGGLKDFQLARLAAHLPEAATIEGALRGEFKVSGASDQPAVEFQLQPSDGLIRVEDETQPFEIAYRNANIAGRFENDQGSVDLNFELGDRGRAKGKLLLGAEQIDTRTLGGNVSVDFPDLALVAGFVPLLEQVQGRLHTEAALGGTLADPQITGVLQIENAQAELPAAGIALSDLQLTVRSDGKTPLRVAGQVSSGDGRLLLDGSVDIAAADGPALDLNLKGENFQVARLPEALVLISPDLRLQGSAPFHLSGNLLIPKAVIELKELPSGTVDLSEDEIVIGEETTNTGGGAQNLTALVNIALGKAVTFKGFGLKTALTGAVDARVGKNGTSINGKIELKDGSYKAYGQELEVEQGRLLFAGPPGNPDVDLRAVRVSRDKEVKAFLALSGPLSKPRPRIYSNPSLPDTEALAYLLTGSGLSSANSEEGANIAGAALSLGVSKSEPLLQQLNESLGLDELRVDSGSGGIEESSLILGKYLNPDLYVGYSQGLFNPEGAVLLRMKLGEKLEVETRSGNEQSIDLFYRLEHD